MKFILILILLLQLSCTNKASKTKSIQTFTKIITLIEKEFDLSKLDSLQKLLIGIKLENYQFIDIDGTEVNIGEIEKPIFLEATASWCKPCKALIPALNEIVEKYHDQIEFILLTHDRKEKAEFFSEGLHPKMKLIPSQRKTNPNSLTKLDMGGFKQIFPFPTTYFVDLKKVIVDVKLGGPIPEENTVEEMKRIKEYNIEELSKSIEKIL